MLGKNIKALRKDHHLTLQALADNLNEKYPKTVNFNKGKLSKWENGREEPKLSSVKILADYFETTVDSLVNGKLEAPILSVYNKLHEPRQKKVLTFAQDQLDEQEGRVEEEKQIFRLRNSAAGPGIYVDDDDYDYEVVTASKVPHGADELVKILGDSMEPLIMKGEKVYIHHQPMVENGEIAIVRIGEEEVTCKHVYINKKEVTLKSENPKYDDMHYDTEKITILGKVIL